MTKHKSVYLQLTYTVHVLIWPGLHWMDRGEHRVQMDHQRKHATAAN